MKGVELSLLPKKEIVEGKIILALLFFCSFYFVGLGPFCWQVHKENKNVTSNVIIEWPCPLRLCFEGIRVLQLSCVYDRKYANEHFVVLRQIFLAVFQTPWNLTRLILLSNLLRHSEGCLSTLGSLYNWTWLARFETLWHFPMDTFNFWINFDHFFFSQIYLLSLCYSWTD